MFRIYSKALASEKNISGNMAIFRAERLIQRMRLRKCEKITYSSHWCSKGTPLKCKYFVSDERESKLVAMFMLNYYFVLSPRTWFFVLWLLLLCCVVSWLLISLKKSSISLLKTAPICNWQFISLAFRFYIPYNETKILPWNNVKMGINYII